MITMKDIKTCSRKGCNFTGIHKVNAGGSTLYCNRHYRFRYMQKIAKRYNKVVPSLEECEEMLLPCLNKEGELGLCPNCNRQMIWRGTVRKRGATISLQHNNDGTMCFICHRCNCSHGNSKLGDEFFELESDEKLCADCNTIKSIDQFNKNTTKSSGFQGICRNCTKNRARKYCAAKKAERDADPDKRDDYRAKERERGRKRRAERDSDPEKRANYLEKERERKRYAAKKAATIQPELVL